MTTATSSTSSNPFAALTQGTGTSAGAAANTVSTSTAASQVSTAYNTFITLLTTQLQHQDPLNPTDTDTFTQELISLSGVEQQLQTNSTLSSMNTDLNSIAQANGLGYVGKTVTATGSVSPLQSGQAQWDYTLNSSAAQVSLSVKDASGTTLYQTTGDTSSGEHSFTWNGKTSGGTTETTGDYTLTVTAVDGSGNAVTTSTAVTGQVTGVDSSNGVTQLQLGDISVPISNITAIN